MKTLRIEKTTTPMDQTTPGGTSTGSTGAQTPVH